MQAKKRNNQMIEIFRGILSLMIIFCHFRVSEPFDLYLVSIARCAVPFFLILSGYYAYSGDKAKDLEHTEKKLLDTLKMILRVAFLYTVVNTSVCIMNNKAPFSWFTEKYLSIKTLQNFLLYNRARFFASIAYYLFMILYVFIIYLFIIKINAVSASFIFIPILLALNLYFSEYLKCDWYLVGNWLLTGLPFFLIGVLLKKKALRLGRKWCILLIFGGIAFTLAEAYKNQSSDIYIYIGTIILSIGIFLFCQTFENENICAPLAKFGSDFSTGVFLYHCAIGHILKTVFNKIALPVNSLFPFIVILATVAAVALFNLLRKAIKSK